MSNKNKEYFCNKMIDLKTCGETDPLKFEKGRYSTCKKCRVKLNSSYVANKKKSEEEQEYKEITDKVDPDYNIRYIVEETFLNTPLIRNKSIVNVIIANEMELTELLNYVNKNFEKVYYQTFLIFFGISIKRC